MKPYNNIGTYLSLLVYNLLLIPSSLYIILIFYCPISSSFSLLCKLATVMLQTNQSHLLTFHASHKTLSVMHLIHSNIFIILNDTYILSVLKYSFVNVAIKVKRQCRVKPVTKGLSVMTKIIKIKLAKIQEFRILKFPKCLWNKTRKTQPLN